MSDELSGMVTLVTGASDGIGEATARALASNKPWRISVASRPSSTTQGVMLLGPVPEAPVDEWQRMIVGGFRTGKESRSHPIGVKLPVL